MEKESINSLELHILLEELKPLVNSVVQKIYQPNSEEFTLYLYDSEKENIFVISPKAVYLSGKAQKNPPTPSQFCMVLRKYLMKKRLISMEQINNDRILKLAFSGCNLYVEMFKKGNLILTDENDIILNALRFHSFSDRDVRTKIIYKHPKPRMDYTLFPTIESKDYVVKLLATDFGLGGSYAEELCYRVGIDKMKLFNKLNNNEKQSLFRALKKLYLQKVNKPMCVYQFGKLYDVVPFEFSSYEKLEKKFFETFSEAVEFYFSNKIKLEDAPSTEDNEMDKLNYMLAMQEANVQELKKQAEDYRKTAEIIKSNLYVIQSIINSLKNALETKSWPELKSVIEAERERGVSEAMMITDLDSSDQTVVFDILQGFKINVYSNIGDVMNDLYGKAKKCEERSENAQAAVFETRTKITSYKDKAQSPPKYTFKAAPARWYHDYRWLYTSNGRLFVAGKDANSNEELIKKRMEGSDIVFHAEISGSPFGLLKNGTDAEDIDKREAAIFTACYSRAWKMNYGAANIYYVYPAQLTKSQSGEYVPRGGFVIKGKKNYYKSVKLELAIGIKIEKEDAVIEAELIAAPMSAIKKQAEVSVIITPGDSTKTSTANQIMKLFQEKIKEEYKPVLKLIKIDQIEKLIPGDARVIL